MNQNIPSDSSTILLIDYADASERLTPHFENEGFEVKVVTDESQAIRYLSSDAQPGVIVINEGFQAIRGYSVIGNLKLLSKTPVVVIGPDRESAITYSLLQGADTYLARTTQPKVVISRIQNLLQRSRGLVEET